MLALATPCSTGGICRHMSAREVSKLNAGGFGRAEAWTSEQREKANVCSGSSREPRTHRLAG